jgi:adenylate cyclase
MKNLLTCCIFFLMAVNAIAQNTPDELQVIAERIRTIRNDQTISALDRCNSMTDLIAERRYSAPADIALNWSLDLLDFSRENNLKKNEASVLTLCGIFYETLAQHDSAISYYEKSIHIYEELKDPNGVAGNYNNIGNVYGALGDIPKAIEMLTQSLRIGETEKDSSIIARALGNIGTFYHQQGDYPLALDFYEKRIAIADAIGDKQCRLEAMIGKAIIHDDLHEVVLARDGFTDCLRMAKEIDDRISIYVSMGGLGKEYILLGDHERGIQLLDSASAMAEEDGDDIVIAFALIDKARSHHMRGMKEKAKEYAKKAMEYARLTNDLTTMRDAAEMNYIILKAQNENADALAMHEFYIVMRDSIANTKNKQSILKQKFEYDFDKKEALLVAEQEKKDAIAEEELRRKNLQRNAFVGGFSLMLLLAGTFFFQRNKISKEKKRSEELLLNILPEEVAEELKAKGEADARQIDTATVLFTDFKGFTAMSELLSPKELVRDIHECFSAFDHIIVKHGIEKIKTIGDAYMAAGGLPVANSTHALDVIKAAIEIRDFIEEGKAAKIAMNKPYFEIRIGIHTGPVVAGIVGVKKFAYDIWGDTVNTASRMESSGEAGKVNISETTFLLVKNETGFIFSSRGKVKTKGKGDMEMYFVEEE